jgi:D-serine dehydratase
MKVAHASHPLPESVEDPIRRQQPLLWLNDNWRPIEVAASSSDSLGIADVVAAERRWHRWAGLLEQLFPELRPTQGAIESPLYAADSLRPLIGDATQAGRWLIKADHALPVAGSVKARGGLYEVLLHAEHLALQAAILQPDGDCTVLASPRARELFSQHQVIVGSTGNLGLSIGIIAAALGFQAGVHMSADAKTWKKARLRSVGVNVIEHRGDYGAAVAAGRAQAGHDARAYFVDDESSRHLFLGYSTAAIRLRQQLLATRLTVDAQHPLFVYIPCGVGGAPGGITFGLRHLFGDHVHCFFAEPVAAPCVLIRLASNLNTPVSISDLGLDGATQADGLAVGRASELVAHLVRPLVSGVFTAADDDLFHDLYALNRATGLRIEPSAAAGLRGPLWLTHSEPGARYLSVHGLADVLRNATHVVWTTGGAMVPEEEHSRFAARGCAVTLSRSGQAV